MLITTKNLHDTRIRPRTPRITKINRAAAEFLDLDQEQTPGRTIQEAARNPELQQFVARALVSDDPVEADIRIITESGERLLP